MEQKDILHNLYHIIEARKHESATASYSAKLLTQGREKIAQKIGEEATELVIEAIKNDKERMISESADLLYHLCVLWHDAGIDLQAISQCLLARQKESGLEEKQNRHKLG